MLQVLEHCSAPFLAGTDIFGATRVQDSQVHQMTIENRYLSIPTIPLKYVTWNHHDHHHRVIINTIICVSQNQHQHHNDNSNTNHHQHHYKDHRLFYHHAHPHSPPPPQHRSVIHGDCHGSDFELRRYWRLEGELINHRPVWRRAASKEGPTCFQHYVTQ